MATKFFKFFRAGIHKNSASNVLEFTESDLEKTAVSYAHMPKKAPLVLGHPANDGPALGEVSSLTFHDGALFAEAEVSDELVNLVRSGVYKNRSAAFFPIDSPLNPFPGVWSLKHIGFLSTQKPALKDLGALNFSESSIDMVFSSHGNCIDLVDLGCMRKQVSFSEGSLPASYPDVRMRMHQAINQICKQHPEFSYIEAARMLESMMLKRAT